jgi:hypothetical protein
MRRTEEIKALFTDTTTSPAIIGTFSFKPQASNSSEAKWTLKDVWICPEEREKGLATVSHVLSGFRAELLSGRRQLADLSSWSSHISYTHGSFDYLVRSLAS